MVIFFLCFFRELRENAGKCHEIDRKISGKMTGEKITDLSIF